ncbi:MAG: CcmD family protein [Ferruginibacter sp.]
MNRMFKYFLAIISSLFTCLSSFAQDKPEMADAMRSNGKIYVVVTVCLIILTGLFLYVWRLDRKISNMEKRG